MDTRSWVEAIAGNSGRLAGAVREAGLDAPVPTCPEWSTRDLLDHVSHVHRWVTGIVERRARERPSRREVPGPEEGDDPLAWFEEGAARLVDVLGAVDPDEVVWNWAAGAPGPVSFWHRRMAHETVVHRVDAQSAAGRSGGVEPPALAVDGIDELLELLGARHRLGDERLRAFTATVHVHTTDTEGEWQVELSPGGVTVRREHGKAAVAVRGPASELELFLYNRRSAGGLEVFGDEALLDAWRERVRL